MNSDDGSIALGGEQAGLPPQKSLKARTLQGVAWTLAGDGGNHIIRFISNLVLARLLVPAQFGVMAMVGIVQMGLAMFSDVGIQPAIVQHKRGDDQTFLDTAWTTQAVRGTLLWLGACAMAWPAAQYYEQPLLVQLLPVIGLQSVFEGFLSTKVFTCDRHLSLGRMTVLNLGCATMGLVVKVSWARVSPTVWALVAGGFAQAVPRVLLSHFLLPGPINRFRWEKEAVRELFQFGRWVFLSTLLTFLALRLDQIWFAKKIPVALFGLYSIGATFARLPLDVVTRITSSVAFPALSRVRDRGGNLASAYARIRAPLLVGCGALLGFLMLAGPMVTRILYPGAYQDAGWIIQLVAGALWFQAIQATNQPVMLAFGQPKWMAIGNLLKIATLAAVLPLAYSRWGFAGALAGMAVVEIPKYLFEAFRVRALGLQGWGVELGMTVAVAACAAIALGVRFWTPLQTPWAGMAVESVCFAAIWIPLLLWARRVATEVQIPNPKSQ